MSRWATKRTSGLSMPMPKAMVATITMPSSRRKRSWWLLAHRGVQAGVVGQGVDALLAQRLRHLLHALARLAVDDAGLALVLALDEAQQLRARVLLLDDRVADVGPVEAADELRASSQLQPLDDVGARQRVGGGGERDARHAGIALVQHRQRAVSSGRKSWPHWLTQCASSMANSAELAALVQRIELRQEARRRHALRRGVQQRDLAARSIARSTSGVSSQSSVELRKAASTPASCSAPTWSCISAISGDTTTVTPLPGALARDRRDLVAQRLAAAGGHQHQRVAAADHVVDDRRPAGRGRPRSRTPRAGRAGRRCRSESGRGSVGEIARIAIVRSRARRPTASWARAADAHPFAPPG